MEVTIKEGDPNWIGAWWLGFPVIGTCIVIFAAPLLLFPERLPKDYTDASKRKKEEESKNMLEPKKLSSSSNSIRPTGISDVKSPKFIAAMKRLVTNKVFIYNFGSTLFYVFGFMGFGTFMPKYMEYNFRMKASSTAGILYTN